MRTYAIIAMMLLLTITSVSAENSISNFVMIDDFAQYSPDATPHVEARYSFDVKYTTIVVVDFMLLQEELVETGEWNITFMIDNTAINDIEIRPGGFVSSEADVSPGTHTLTVIADAKPNVIPATYNYIVTILSDDVVLTHSSSGGSGIKGNWTITGPTVEPTETSISTQTIVANVTNKTVQVDIPGQPDEPGTSGLWWLSIPTTAAVLLYIYYRRSKSYNP